jgi:hypothetical protein
VCSISHSSSCCASSEHAAHASSMATTMTRRARVTCRGVATLLRVAMLLWGVPLLRGVTVLLRRVAARCRRVTTRCRRVAMLRGVPLRWVSLLGRVALLWRVPVATSTCNAVHQVGHEPLVPLVMVVIASSHLLR